MCVCWAICKANLHALRRGWLADVRANLICCMTDECYSVCVCVRECVHVIISIDTCITPYELTSRPGCLCQAVCFPFVICLCITQAKRLKRFDRCPIHKAAIPNNNNNNNNNGNIKTCRQSQRGKGGNERLRMC